MATIHAFPADVSHFVQPGTLSHAIEARREYVKGEVAALCCLTTCPRVLCIGASALWEIEPLLGSLTEAEAEVVVIERNAARFTECGEERVAFIEEDACAVDRRGFGSFDLIYAPNLLNEASDAPAKRVIARLAAMLNRGGKLLLTNLSPDVADAHYASKRAILRNEEDVAALSASVPDQHIIGQVVWRDDSGLLVFLEINR